MQVLIARIRTRALRLWPRVAHTIAAGLTVTEAALSIRGSGFNGGLMVFVPFLLAVKPVKRAQHKRNEKREEGEDS